MGVDDQGKTRLADRGYRGPKTRQVLGSSGEERPERSRSPRSNSRPSAGSLPGSGDACSVDAAKMAASTLDGPSRWKPGGSRDPKSVIPIRWSASASSPKARAGCGSPARPDPWRGPRATAVPTPTHRGRAGPPRRPRPRTRLRPPRPHPCRPRRQRRQAHPPPARLRRYARQSEARSRKNQRSNRLNAPIGRAFCGV
jgi:hypothetical protein